MNYRRICVICGKEFTTTVHNKITCSIECKKKRKLETNRKNSKRRKKRRKCCICGKYFTPKTGNQITCSTECRTKRDNEKQRERYARERNIDLNDPICEICGKPFRRIVGRQKFCSEKCRKIATEGIKHEETKVTHKLEDTLRECEERGETYAQQQMRKTLAGVEKINLTL